MNKFSYVSLILIILSSCFCLAEVVNKPIEVDFNDLPNEIESLNTQFQGMALEGAVGKIFGDEIINIYIKLDNGQEQIVNLITEDKKVKSLSIGANEKPTLIAQTTETVLKDILSSKNPEWALKKALQEKKVNYQARGFFKKIKLSLVSLFVNFNTEDTENNEEKNETETATDETVTEEKEEKEEEETEETEEPINESETEIEENETEIETPIEPLGPKTYTVEVKADGFNPKELKIKVNEIVEWKNLRNANTLKIAMILGTQECSAIKSGMLKTDETFSWTFTKPMKCTIVDGVTTTQISKIIVE